MEWFYLCSFEGACVAVTDGMYKSNLRVLRLRNFGRGSSGGLVGCATSHKVAGKITAGVIANFLLT
jgi:hypothetical protein